MKSPSALAVLVAACTASAGSYLNQASAVLTVRSVLNGAAPVGVVVRVEGRCLGYGPPFLTVAPPRTRSDWQLGTDSVAVYVTGALPGACHPALGSSRIDTIIARVSVDTLRLGEQPPIVRWYLERVQL